MLTDFLDEQRIESMTAAGRKIVDAAIAEYRPVAIVAAFSGGNDSIVSTHFALAEYGHLGAFALHCDTSIGLPESRAHVDAVASRFRWDVWVRRVEPKGPPGKHADGSLFDPASLPSGRWADGDTAYEEWVLNFGFPGPRAHSIAYRRLKERSIDKAKAECKAGHARSSTVLFVAGIRRDESAVRAGYKAATRKVGSAVWVNPFYWNDAADFEAYRQEFGLPRNPVKATVGISGECCCGSFAGEGEKHLIGRVNAGFADYLTSLEARVCSNGFPWQWGQDPPSWWGEGRRGQGFLFPPAEDHFMPMCVGCKSRKGPPHLTPAAPR